MRPHRVVLICLALVSFAAAFSGPKDRKLTDPKSVQSASNPESRPVAIDDLFVTRIINDASLSPDGTRIALTTNLTGRTNLWEMSADGSWPVQLINSDDRQSSEMWSPDSRWIAYAQDSGGNELYDIYLISRDGGTPINLTNSPDIREEHPYWSHDGKRIACTYKPAKASSYEIAIIDVASRKLRQLTSEKDPQFSWNVVGFSPDDRTIFANRTIIGFDDGDVYSIDIENGQLTNLTAHQGKQLNVASSVASDGKTLLMTSDRKNGFVNLALLDVSSKKLQWVTDTEWEVSWGVFSPDGSHFTYSINQDGRSTIYLGERATGRSTEIQLPPGTNGLPGDQQFTPDGRKLLVTHEAMNAPGDLWMYDLSTKTAKQLTHTAVASLSPKTLPPSDVVHYKTFDGQTISAVLRIPFNLKRDGSNPAIILPHGGPTGQTTDSWNRWANSLATQGYIVLAPNPRGSTGYGMEFQRGNYQDLGGGDLKDEMAGLQWLLQTGYVDAKKVGVWGGSYGGFMTLMLAAKEPQTFAAAVDLFGPLDWYTMLQHSDPFLNQYIRSLLGDPEKDRKIYEETSPIKYVQNIKAPLLVLQGENDSRVPKEETEQLVKILKDRGNVVDVVYYPNEGHGFDKVEHQIDAAKKSVAWFNKYLKGSTAQP